MCAQGTDQVSVNIMTVHRCQSFFFCASDSCFHVTPQVVHSFVTTELHSKQSTTKEPAIIVEGLCDVSVFPQYAFCCWIFSAAAKKNKKRTMIFVGLISRANDEFKLHTVKALHPKLS